MAVENSLQRMVCPCCDREVDSLGKNIWVSEPVCTECRFVWYDEGLTDPVKIKERVLQKITAKESA